MVVVLKKFRPGTPGRRFMVSCVYNKKNNPFKSLTKGRKYANGRNNYGQITVKRRGGGHKKKYRMIDVKRDKYDVSGEVMSIEYDPNRSSFISLISYKDGDKRYVITPKNINIKDEIISSRGPVDIKEGNATVLSHVPIGVNIHCVESEPGGGGVFARSAGGCAQIFSKEDGFAAVRLSSNEQRLIPLDCMATIGAVSNAHYKQEKFGKAGKNRWLGRRPRVRAVAMNPVDHPMGGGEGKASGGQPRSRNGIPSKGYKTRKKNKYSDRYVLFKK